MSEDEKKGYEAWLYHVERTGQTPSLADCPARYMEHSQLRTEYLRGWRKAHDEYFNS